MNLQYFIYKGPFIKFSFIGVPKLQTVNFTVNQKRDMQYIFSQLAKDIPNLRTVTVNSTIDLCIPKSMTDITIFRKVKIYHLLIYGDMEFHLMKMTFLLKAFPNIQEFYLKMNGSVDFKHRGNPVPVPVPKTYVHKHLN